MHAIPCVYASHGKQFIVVSESGGAQHSQVRKGHISKQLSLLWTVRPIPRRVAEVGSRSIALAANDIKPCNNIGPREAIRISINKIVHTTCLVCCYMLRSLQSQ